jgi:hypothetical protein
MVTKSAASFSFLKNLAYFSMGKVKQKGVPLPSELFSAQILPP